LSTTLSTVLYDNKVNSITTSNDVTTTALANITTTIKTPDDGAKITTSSTSNDLTMDMITKTTATYACILVERCENKAIISSAATETDEITIDMSNDGFCMAASNSTSMAKFNSALSLLLPEPYFITSGTIKDGANMAKIHSTTHKNSNVTTTATKTNN
jgi:hypothetical protein